MTLPLALLLLARVGGGEGYSDGGGGGGGGGGGDLDPDTIFFLIRLCIQHPKIGVPVACVVIAVVVIHKRSLAAQRLGDGPPRVRRAAPASSWQALAAVDPRFSRVVLFDFLTRLFVRYQHLRGEGDVDALAPYLAPKVLDDLRAVQAHHRASGQRIIDVVIGGVEVTDVNVGADGAASLVVRYELNESVQAKDGTVRQYFERQTWRLDRAAGARSPEPEAARTLGCPSCGAPMRYNEQNRCAHCDTVVDAGRFTWRVTGVAMIDKRPVEDRKVAPPGGMERGTTLPDVVDPRLPGARAAFEKRYPRFDWADFEAHVRRVFLGLQAAWTARSWQQARPFETDPLFHSHRFHLEGLVRRGLHNRVEQVEVRRVTVVRVESDAFFDAITARIHASTIDVTVDAQGKVVSGSATQARVFSEYWTFVRSAGYEPPKEPRDPQGCPSCGASLELTQAGDCVHCGNTVTTGRFGWVVSTLEQDEAYAG